MVRVTDELNAYTDGNFTLTLTNVVEDPDGDGIESHLIQMMTTTDLLMFEYNLEVPILKAIRVSQILILE